jgi:hypothetical protein
MIKTNETEQEFVNKLITTFSKHFKVESEVWSKCKNGRIDLVLTLNDNIHFGIECKAPSEKRGEKIGEYIKQAIRYSNYEFYINGSYKKIPILICPALSYNYLLMKEETIFNNGYDFHRDRHKEYDSHHTVNGILGSFGIGEVRKSHDKSYYFSVSNKTIFQSSKKWNSNNIIGLHEVNYNKLLKKLSI